MVAVADAGDSHLLLIGDQHGFFNVLPGLNSPVGDRNDRLLAGPITLPNKDSLR